MTTTNPHPRRLHAELLHAEGLPGLSPIRRERTREARQLLQGALKRRNREEIKRAVARGREELDASRWEVSRG